MNVVRVIYVDQNVIVDVCECMRPSKQHGREQQRELRAEIERCVDSGIAIFPYSEVHLTEAANVSDPESRSEQIGFWEKVSRRYRFHDEGDRAHSARSNFWSIVQLDFLANWRSTDPR